MINQYEGHNIVTLGPANIWNYITTEVLLTTVEEGDLDQNQGADDAMEQDTTVEILNDIVLIMH